MKKKIWKSNISNNNSKIINYNSLSNIDSNISIKNSNNAKINDFPKNNKNEI